MPLDGQSLFFPDPTRVAGRGPALVGGDLHPERLIAAYAKGYFPWYAPGDPLLWWNPDPRFVLFPAELRIAKSMRPYLNQHKYRLSFDQAFYQVIKQCREIKRPGQSGESWIDDAMIDAYIQLHELGFAHSVEAWEGEELVGGLYGIALDQIFFGESMFSLRPNSSKFTFIRLVQRLQEYDYRLVDCQQETAHLASLGGRSIRRAEFLAYLPKNTAHFQRDLGPWMTLD
ncbi:MAG: leucyl/phenylalanyl-tRNA--protein transferase [Bacteroidota bacterium]